MLSQDRCESWQHAGRPYRAPGHQQAVQQGWILQLQKVFKGTESVRITRRHSQEGDILFSELLALDGQASKDCGLHGDMNEPFTLASLSSGGWGSRKWSCVTWMGWNHCMAFPLRSLSNSLLQFLQFNHRAAMRPPIAPHADLSNNAGIHRSTISFGLLTPLHILWNILLQVGGGESASQMQASCQMEGARTSAGFSRRNVVNSTGA